MNSNSTHADWHPGETDEWLEEQVSRIRAEIAAAQMPQEPEVARHDWWYGNRIIPADELRGIYRRAAKRGNNLTDEPIGRGAPTTLTVIRGRVCQDCGATYDRDPVVGGGNYCPSCRSKRGKHAHRKAGTSR